MSWKKAVVAILKKEMIISVTGRQRYPEGQDNEIELVTMGTLYKTGDTIYIEYEENQLSDDDGKTIITIESDIISMERVGSNTTKLIFQKGKKYVNHYDTAYGTLELGIFPTMVDTAVDEAGGNLFLKYQLDIDGMYTSTNELTITLKERKH